MLDHLLIITLMALVATGAYAIQQEGMILEPLSKFWMKHFPEWLQPALWKCPICTTSVWGLPAALFMALWIWDLPTGFWPAIWVYGLPSAIILIPQVFAFAVLYLFASAGLSSYLNK